MDQEAVVQQFNFQMFGSAFGNSSVVASCLNAVDKSHQKKGNGRKNKGRRKSSKSWRKTLIVKGQWNSEEDR